MDLSTELHVEIVRIGRDDARYPVALMACLGGEAPASLAALGNLELLSREKLALFCSVRCPGRLIVQSYDLAHRLRESGLAVAGGFHSPMEREWLEVLLRGPAPVILCPARNVDRMRIPVEYREPLASGRLLILSPFSSGERRATGDTALYRNRFAAALADLVFVAYAQPGGKVESLAREVLSWEKPLCTFESDANGALLALGAKPLGFAGLPGPEAVHRAPAGGAETATLWDVAGA